MAYRAVGTTSAELFRQIKDLGLISSKRVEQVLYMVDRKCFMPYHDDQPLRDAPEFIGHNATISAPHMIGKGAKVVGVDHIPQLVEASKENIRRAGFGGLLDDGTIEIVVQDGRLGYSKYSPYDVIHVGAAAERIPQPLVDQLKENGRMILPVDNDIGYQDYISVDKNSSSDGYKIEKLMAVSYVPLTDIDKQLRRI